MMNNKFLVDKWTKHNDNVRKKFIYLQNSYIIEFCWWYTITRKDKIKFSLDLGDEIGKGKEQFSQFNLQDFTYLDKLWSLYDSVKDKATIYVKNEDINKRKATIDLSKTITHLLPSQKEGKGLNDFTKIHAYSFGAFNLENFVNSKFKILWILKEPLITPYDFNQFECGYKILGGFNQADDYYRNGWNTIRRTRANDGNKTIANILRTSRQIIESRTQILSSSSSVPEEDIMKIVMDNVAILEINHFPGLNFCNFKTDGGLLKNWCSQDIKDEIEDFISDFEIKIVIGNEDNLYLLTNNDHTFGNLKSITLEEFKKKYPKTLPTILSREIINSIKQINGVILDSENTMWFCWYHPSASKNPDPLIAAISDALMEWQQP